MRWCGRDPTCRPNLVFSLPAQAFRAPARGRPEYRYRAEPCQRAPRRCALRLRGRAAARAARAARGSREAGMRIDVRSEEHTSELQSRQYLVCRLLLEKKNNMPRQKVHCAVVSYMKVPTGDA